MRKPDEGTAPALETAQPTWRWKLVAAAGALSIMISVGGVVEREFGLNRPLAANALERAELAADRLAWIGQDSPNTWLTMGRLALADGDIDRAMMYLERGVEVFPTTSGWMVLGEAREKHEDVPRAIEAYRASVALSPDNTTAQLLLANALVTVGEKQLAREILEDDRRRAVKGSLRSQRLRENLVTKLTEEPPRDVERPVAMETSIETAVESSDNP